MIEEVASYPFWAIVKSTLLMLRRMANMRAFQMYKNRKISLQAERDGESEVNGNYGCRQVSVPQSRPATNNASPLLLLSTLFVSILSLPPSYCPLASKVRPPSTQRHWPSTYAPAWLHKYRTTPAMSSILPILWAGMALNSS